MSWFYSDDPARDAERHSAEQDRQVELLPICCNCGEYIRDERYYNVTGDIYCSTCLDETFGRYTYA